MIQSYLPNKFIVLCCALGVLVTSCATKQDVVYFQNAKSFETVVDTDTFKAKLKVGDIVSVYVSTLDPLVTAPYNIIIASGSGGQLIDYLIDVDGNIDYPVLGKLKLVGLTVEEAKELIKKKFSEGQLLKDPVVMIRVLNFRVTVAGEVRSPGVYPVSGERVSILEALGMAGDLTIKGRRDNVLVIRDFNGTKTYTRIDLTNKEVFNSPVYYLTQNDYVYVEPNNSAISGASGDIRIGTIITITSFILTTALIFVTRN
ncbi:polysaccharide biosynthesis/export family protein [Mariniflexile maritimum]|jgi:polysaccharide export outer membrane protein|uniref:polysaccharide biosynthesis/export family protein n=1 Tax=Mariniflexile maritimum TaxID=2682493 RepID=UPI0012F6AE67|nr:polysaccharide biosynthesis/export family protein [Mariniflexile maritimum]MCB0449925.1 polysaccharide biosynthesis/export family protein [Confluentibacter sp.]